MGSIDDDNTIAPSPGPGPATSKEEEEEEEEAAGLPYWQVNVAPADREAECPAFLRGLSAKDEGIVGTPDARHRRPGWPEVRDDVVGQGRIDLFRRGPSDLRRYLGYQARLRERYGSVEAFVLGERLGWDRPVAGSSGGESGGENGGDLSRLFQDPDKIRVLRNDWPYGIDPRIVHLVVWTRFELPDDPATGELTGGARADVDAYVRRAFGARVPSENYVWFKNWRSLKSVHAVEHFHVMLYDPDPDFVRDITGGDVPLCDKV